MPNPYQVQETIPKMSSSFEERLTQLIPEIGKFSGNESPVWQWLECFGDVDNAMIYGHLFWPQFYKKFGGIFLQPPSRKSFNEWMASVDNDIRRVERVLNHRHLAEMLFNSHSIPTIPKLLHFGEILKQSWLCKLRLDYPGLEFVVTLTEGNSESPTDITITFYSKI